MLHARGQLLADITALGEGDAIQFIQPRIQREDLFGPEIAAFRHAQPSALRMIGAGPRQIGGISAMAPMLRTPKPGARGSAKLTARSACAASGWPRDKHPELWPRLDLHLGAQFVHFQSLEQRLRKPARQSSSTAPSPSVTRKSNRILPWGVSRAV